MGFFGDALDQIASIVQGGGAFNWIIILIWFLGLGIGLEKYLKFLVYDIDGASFMNEIQKYVLAGDIPGAIKICSNNQSLLPRIFKHGLKRAGQQGEQIQNAIDSVALEVFPRIDSRLGYLGLIANISTLLGLLGTIFGLIDSFSAVAVAEASMKAELLAKGIALAMNTTALGLISAISIMVVHSLLSSKAEKIVSTIDEFSVKFVDLLATRNELATQGTASES